MKAFVFTDGQIKFGNSVSPGAIQVCSGHAKTVHETVATLAIHGYNKNVFIVPGVREAVSRAEIIAAITAFAIECTRRIERRKAKGVRHAA